MSGKVLGSSAAFVSFLSPCHEWRQVILWDKVVESTDEAHLFEEDMTIKYGLIDEVCDQIMFSFSVTSIGRSIIQVVSELFTDHLVTSSTPALLITFVFLLMLLPLLPGSRPKERFCNPDAVLGPHALDRNPFHA